MNLLDQFLDCMVKMPFETGLFLAVMFLPFILLTIFWGTLK